MQGHAKVIALVSEDGAQLDDIDSRETAQGLETQPEIGQPGKGSGTFKTFAKALVGVSLDEGLEWADERILSTKKTQHKIIYNMQQKTSTQKCLKAKSNVRSVDS